MPNDFIAAKPFAYPLDGQVPCLLIIDMQKDFLYPDGFGASLGNNVGLLEPAIEVVKNLLTLFREKGFPIIHTKEAHKADLSDCSDSKRLRGNPTLRIGDNGPMGRILIDGEPGSDIVEALQPLPGEKVIVKPGKGAFYQTDLQNHLQRLGVNKLVITGVTTEVCVQTTMREANDRGFDCLLVEDGTESYFPAFKQAVLDMVVAQAGIVGWTCTSDQLTAALS